MKKLLLTMAVALTSLFCASAATVEYDFLNNEYGLTRETDGNAAFITTPATVKNGAVSLDLDKTGGNGFRLWADGLRIYKTGSGEASVQVQAPGNVTEIIITYKANSAFSTVKIGDTAFTQDTKALTYTWTGDLANPTIAITSTKGNYPIVKLSVTYTEGAVDPGTPAVPTITVSDDFTVTLACETEGAKIYYTTDDTLAELTKENGTLYAEPFTVPASCTVRAIAVNGDKVSAVARQAIVVPVVYTTVADVNANAQKDDKVDCTATLTFVYSAGSGNRYYNYFTDGTGYLLAYGEQVSATNGNTFKGINGTWSPYKNLPELASFTLGEAGESVAAVEPQVVDFSFLTKKANFNSYIKLENVKIENNETDGKTYLYDANGIRVVLRDQFNLFNKGAEFVDGEGYTVTGFAGVYNEETQVFPVTIEGGVVEEPAATPVFSPAGGTITEATEVTITCATEGASIYYTLNGTEPTAESTLYETPITVDATMTIKAIAIAEGFLPSEVALAEFVYDNGDTPVPSIDTVTFDFTKPTELTPAITPAEQASTGVKVDGTAFTEGLISATFSKSEDNVDSQTPVVFTTTSSTYEIRLYKKNTFVIAASGNTNISKIEFAGSAISGIELAENENGTYQNNIWTPSAADVENKVINFVINASASTQKLNTIAVTYTTTTGVESVAAEDADAPVEYYNLQGVRVENPANGLYIRRQGNTATKVLVK